MKSYKLKRKHYTSLETLLKDVGLVSADGKEAYPSSALIGPETEKKMRKALLAMVKKEFPYRSSRSQQTSIEMYLLNLGPSVLPGIKEGYVLVIPPPQE